MKDPWFEKWGFIGYRPINWKGTLTIVLMSSTFALFALSSAYLEAVNDSASSICAMVALAIAVIGHGVVFTHMSDGFR